MRGPDSRDQRVRIAGAGPAGLAAAIELAQRGQAVWVFERRPEVGGRFDGDHQILPAFGPSPHGLDLLRELGVGLDSLEFTPLHHARFLAPGLSSVDASSAQPYAYLIRRGAAEGTLDSALARRARELGVRIECGQALDPSRAEIVATGLRRVDGLAIERMFETRCSDRVDVLLDEDLAPGGYAYLFVRSGEATLGIAALGDFDDLDRRLETARAIFHELEPFDEQAPRSAAHGMNFALPHSLSTGETLRVGEAAGFQDFLFGLGLQMALASGRLAARARIEGLDYDELCRRVLVPRQQLSLVDRWLYERGWIRRALFARLRAHDLRETLELVQADHWAKRALLPVLRRTRLRFDADHGLVPRKRKARA